jgi:hypothetical protein
MPPVTLLLILTVLRNEGDSTIRLIVVLDFGSLNGHQIYYMCRGFMKSAEMFCVSVTVHYISTMRNNNVFGQVIEAGGPSVCSLDEP